MHNELVGSAPRPARAVEGSISLAIHSFMKSLEFQDYAENTKSVRRRALEEFREKYGDARLVDLRARHIRKDLADLDAHPANSRLKVWRAFCKWCHGRGMIETNPAADVLARKTPKSDGHTPWAREDFVTYRGYWPLDSKQRLAFEIMYLTCAAIGDACRIGEGNVRDGWITYRRQKSASTATCPYTAPAPDWSEPDGLLAAALAARGEQHINWIVTEYGGVRSPKAAAQWFSASCTEAGLAHLTSHGIRKGRAAMFKENGASLEQRLAWLGQETEAEGRHYSKSADLRRVIETGTESANSPQPSANFSG